MMFEDINVEDVLNVLSFIACVYESFK